MRVIIVGGSISGLVHGVMLKHHGHSVHILERNIHDLEAQGAGISTTAEAEEYLALHDRVQFPLSLPSNGVRVYDRDSELVQEMRIPMQMCTWDAMYYRLRANFDGLATQYCPNPPQDEPTDGDVKYQMGANVTEIETPECTKGPIIVSCTHILTGNMSSLEADLVIGADGAASNIKRLIAPHAPPRTYTGYIAWRGIIPETAVSESTRERLSDWFTFHVSPRSYVVVYPIPGPFGALEKGSRSLNFVWYSWQDEAALRDILTDTDSHTHRYTVPSGKLRNEVWEEQKAEGVSVFSKEFAEMLEVTEKPFVQVITDCSAPINPGPAFFNGRVLLVGDAQTVLRPHTGFALSMTSKHCLELEKRLTELEREIMGIESDKSAKSGAVERWSTGVLEFSHVARLRSVAIGTLYLTSKPAAIPALLRWKLAELWLAMKNIWRKATGTQI